MPQFRKKPVVIEAMQLTDDNVREVQAWCNAAVPAATVVQHHPLGSNAGDGVARWLVLLTIHGEQAIARPGDWVIPEPQPGRFYPCASTVFDATYEPVTP
jgi:hypothetical protein